MPEYQSEERQSKGPFYAVMLVAALALIAIAAAFLFWPWDDFRLLAPTGVPTNGSPTSGTPTSGVR